MRAVGQKLTRSNSGFTLLELIIAMTIIAVLAAIIYNGMRLAIQARERGENIEENNQRMRAIYSMIASQIRSAKPYFYKESEESKVKKFAFIGKPDSIQFITTAPRLTPAKRWEGLHESTIYLEPWEDEGEYEDGVIRGLVLREDRLHYPIPFEEEVEPVVLAEDVSDLQFRYFFVMKGEGEDLEEMWVDHYDAETVRELEAALKGEDASEEEATGQKKSSLIRLPLAVEVAFSVSIPRKKEGETSLVKLDFPPTLIFVNLGLEGTPIADPSYDDSAVSGGKP